MIRRLLRSRTGTAAVEFAFVAPIFLLAGIAICAFGLLAWRWSILDTVAISTARCIAVGAPECGAAASGTCPSADAAICYALRRADALGFGGLTAGEVAIRHETLAAGIAVVRVDLRHRSTIAGYGVPLSTSASFPVP